MPRSSRHKSSHKSQRRSSPVVADWSGGSEEEREPVAEVRVSRESESEKRKSRELRESGNGYSAAAAGSDHGKKRKERVVVESKDEPASDRWDSGLGKDGGDDDAVVMEKRSKGDVYGAVDVEREKEKEKYSKEESKSRSSRRHEERSEEKRRYKEEKEREREKEKIREKEKDKEKDRDRERSSRREKYEEDKREKEKERYEGDSRRGEKEMYEDEKKEKERHSEDRREKHRYEEGKREKERYDEDSKREKGRHDDGGGVSRKKEFSEVIRMEDGGSVSNKDVDIITEADPTEREQREKHSKRRRDDISSEEKEKDKDRERERDKDREREREKEKERHRDDHSKTRSSTKEHKSEPEKYKEKHRDRDRDRERDREREDRREREYYEHKSSREGNRSSESRYKKSKGAESDPYDNNRDEYLSKHKDGHGSKKSYDATTEDNNRHERDLERDEGERSRGEYRYNDKEKEKEREREKEKEKIDSMKSSPGAGSYHDREQNRHRSKPLESPKKDSIQDDKPRARTSSSAGERTPSRLRDEKFNNKPRGDDAELSSEIASSTPRSSDRASPKFAPEISPPNTGTKYSSRGGGGGSSKYRDRDSDVHTPPDKPMMHKREPTPGGTYNNRSNSGNNNYPPLYEDGDNRRDNSINDRRFHKRGGNLGTNNWNGGAPNWASQVNNGFMPLPGPPPPSGFHHFGAPPPPPIFGIRPPPLKLGPSNIGVPFPMHDPMERFSGHMRGAPYGWHNGAGNNNPLVDDAFPPGLWGPAGNGMFGAEPFWDPNNRPIIPSWKSSQSEMVNNKEMINVPQKDINAAAAAALVNKMEEHHVINENLISESGVEIKDESVKGGSSSVEAILKDQKEQQKVVLDVDKSQEADNVNKVVNFWESYLPRACISHNLIDLEILKKSSCAAVGELEILNGVSNATQVDSTKGRGKRNGMSIIVLKSLFPTSKEDNFEKSLSLYKKLSNRQKPEKNNVLVAAPDLKEPEVHNMHVEAATDNVNIIHENVAVPNEGNDMEVDKMVSSNIVSDNTDSIIFKNTEEECEQVMKKESSSGEDGLSKIIPISSTESTH